MTSLERNNNNIIYYIIIHVVIPSEARSPLGLESRFVWLLGAYVLRTSKFSLLLSSANQATSPSVSES